MGLGLNLSDGRSERGKWDGVLIAWHRVVVSRDCTEEGFDFLLVRSRYGVPG